MRIPESLKIAGLDWKVVKDKYIGSEAHHFGESRFVQQEIAILEDGKDQRNAQTLLHEILEVINAEYELKLEHNVLSTLETSLYQVLKDNKLHFDEEEDLHGKDADEAHEGQAPDAERVHDAR